jgi:hypothetical protein
MKCTLPSGTKASLRWSRAWAGKGRRQKLRGKRGRSTLEGEKPPVLGMLQRNGEVVIQMVPNV